MCSPATSTTSSMPRASVVVAGPVGPWPLAGAAGWCPRRGHRAGDGTGRATQPGLFVPLADDEECQSGTATGDGPVRLVGCRPGLARPGDPSAAGRVEPAAAGHPAAASTETSAGD